MKMFHENYTVFSVFKKSKHFFENHFPLLPRLERYRHSGRDSIVTEGQNNLLMRTSIIVANLPMVGDGF